MKKIIFIIGMIVVGSIVIYFNQDRMALHIVNNKQNNGETKFEFSDENHLKKIIQKDRVISFELDDGFTRVKKSVDGKVIEKYLWQGDEKLYIVTDAKDNVLREYLYKTKYDSLPYGMKSNNQLYRFIYNKMRTLRVVLNNQNKIVKVIDYDKYGQIIKDTNPSLQVDFSYGSGLLESSSGLLFFPEGVYNPKKGVWITKIENDDVIQNLTQLSNLPKKEVYQCSDTLDTYYHSYLCTNGNCGGFYSIDYLEYFDTKGVIGDNSKYFHLNRCNKVEIDTKKYDTNRFSLCVEKRIKSKEIKRFDAISHNCHHEVDEIISNCKNSSIRGKS